jgi:hypothetical protein
MPPENEMPGPGLACGTLFFLMRGKKSTVIHVNINRNKCGAKFCIKSHNSDVRAER